MNYDRQPASIPATAGYILDVIRDQHRQASQVDSETNPDADLTFESTVAEWREACDLLDWRRLGHALDEQWKLGRSTEDWRAVLEPAGQRTLRDLCEFIAEGAVRPAIEPLRILGGSCLPAGAFLAIRSMLREAGADADRVMPSTPLDEFARRYPGVFLGPISRLAPNALPPVRMSTPWHDLLFVGCMLSVLATFAGSYFFPLAIVPGMVLIVAFALAGWFAVRWIPPSRVEFGDLRTFRDLAKVVAEGAPAVGL